MSDRATFDARAWGPRVDVNMEARPMWHYMCVLTELPPPPSIGLANCTAVFIIREIACIIY